jgi:hypothetical protein
MNPARHQVAPLSLLIVLACASTLAFAALKNKPPEGVKLAGTQWQLDPYNSDEPSDEIDRAGQRAQRSSGPSRPMGGGVFGGGNDPTGRGSDPVGGGGGYGLPSDRDRGGGWHRGGDGNSTDIDPTGQRQTITMQMGGARSSIFFESLRTNPDKLSFAEGTRNVTVSADGIDTECEAGVKAPFSDSYGDGVRNCGWSGRAWVVETTRGRSFSRTDRYELSKDGKTLKYTTTATEDGVGRVTINRRYQLPPRTG